MTKVLPAVIKSFQGGSPGPASGITYTVTVDFGVTIQDVAGVIPHTEREPDLYDVRACKNGTAIVCHQLEGGFLQFYFHERLDVTTCGG